MNEDQLLPEINSYTNKDGQSVVAHYKNGQLLTTSFLRADKIEWDGIKHDIPFYESELNLEQFKLIE